ncbi:MAG: UDP-N-acetylmuramate dehydrogenase [Candidatus Magasanikiibacteriota bacterium]
MSELYQQLKEFGHVKLNEPMSKHTTFKIGGKANFFITIENTDNLGKLLTFVNEQGLSYFILGGGSNLLWNDDQFEGVVIKVGNKKLTVTGNMIEADAGVLLSQVVNLAAQNSLTGFEWAVGIPGTIGGAVRGNAGAMGVDISADKCLAKVQVWQNGEVVEYNRSECNFVYRGSMFKDDPNILVLRAYFRLDVGDQAEIMKSMQGYLAQRTGRYPKFPSAGSFFQNVPIDKWKKDLKDLPAIFVERKKIPVGWLVEQLELKGLTVGGAKVSDEHGNFIINFDNALQSDVLTLVELVKEKVYNKFGIELESEVEIV